jgi:hypothetical protein
MPAPRSLSNGPRDEEPFEGAELPRRRDRLVAAAEQHERLAAFGLDEGGERAPRP